MEYSGETMNRIRNREEYHIAREYVSKLIIKRKQFNTKVNSYGIKNYISNYIAKYEPDRNNYISNEDLITLVCITKFS